MALTKIDAPEKPQGQDLMDLLLQPEKFRQHLERLEEAHRRLDEKLATLSTLEEAETLRAQASAALAEGNTFREIALAERRDAASFLARARMLAQEEADQIGASAAAEAEAIRRETQAAADAVAARERDVAVTEASVLMRESSAAARFEAAERKAEAAERLFTRWERKLQMLRAIADE